MRDRAVLDDATVDEDVLRAARGPLIGERGGMEVSTTRLEFKAGVLKVLMYRTPDGKIQQLFIQKG